MTSPDLVNRVQAGQKKYGERSFKKSITLTSFKNKTLEQSKSALRAHLSRHSNCCSSRNRTRLGASRDDNACLVAGAVKAVVRHRLLAEQVAGHDALVVELFRLLASAIRPAVIAVSLFSFLLLARPAFDRGIS